MTRGRMRARYLLPHGQHRNRTFEDVLLRRDGGNREAPPGGWMAREEHERLLRAVISAGWPERKPGWPAFLEGGAVLRVFGADANWWMPRALRTALHRWRYRPRQLQPPQPPQKRWRTQQLPLTAPGGRDTEAFGVSPAEPVQTAPPSHEPAEAREDAPRTTLPNHTSARRSARPGPWVTPGPHTPASTHGLPTTARRCAPCVEDGGVADSRQSGAEQKPATPGTHPPTAGAPNPPRQFTLTGKDIPPAPRPPPPPHLASPMALGTRRQTRTSNPSPPPPRAPHSARRVTLAPLTSHTRAKRESHSLPPWMSTEPVCTNAHTPIGVHGEGE